MKLVFLCVANSARSQIAEGLARSMLAPKDEIESAGSAPTTIHPIAVEVMAEIGIDTGGQAAKAIADLSFEGVDYVITLCAEEVCPVVPHTATRLHWPIPDPAAVSGTPDSVREAFRATREAIANRLREFQRSLSTP